MRLIDADRLFEVIEKSMAENPHKEKTQRAMHIHEHKYFLTLLTGFPTIQLEERTEKRTETHTCDSISRQAALQDDAECQMELKAYRKHLAGQLRAVGDKFDIVRVEDDA